MVSGKVLVSGVLAKWRARASSGTLVAPQSSSSTWAVAAASRLMCALLFRMLSSAARSVSTTSRAPRTDAVSPGQPTCNASTLGSVAQGIHKCPKTRVG